MLRLLSILLLFAMALPAQAPVASKAVPKMEAIVITEGLSAERSSEWKADQILSLNLDGEASDWGLAPPGFAATLKGIMDAWPKKGEPAKLVIKVKEWQDGKGLKRALTLGDLSVCTLEALIIRGEELLGVISGKIGYRAADVKDFSATAEKIISEKLYRALQILQKGGSK